MCTCSGGGGFGAVLAPGLQVYKAWADTVNAAGGIDGHQVQLISEDDGGNPGTATSEVQTLISDHVVAVADISLVDVAWQTAIKAANIPVVGVLSYEVPFYTNSDFYSEGQTTDSSPYSVATIAKAAGGTNAAYLYCAEAANCAQVVPLIKAAGQQVGLPIIYTAAIAQSAPNYTAQCLAAKQKGVTVLYIGEAAPIIIRVAADCARQGYDPIYPTEGAGFAMDETTATGLTNNSWFEFQTLPFFATNVPAVKTADDAIDKYYPGLLENKTGFTNQNFMSWPSGLLLEDAIKAGGLTASTTPTASEVVSGLHALKGDTLQGFSPPLTFTAGKPNPVDCWFTVRIQNSTPKLLNNGQVSCEKNSS